MKKFSLVLFTLSLLSLFAVAKMPTDVSERLGSRWQRQSLFFGVNEAWKLKANGKVQVTYLARDQYRPFVLSEFPFEKYPEYLTQLRATGLKVAGITDWKIESYEYKKTPSEGILIKVSGTYQRREQEVHFTEWQLFEEERYSQANLIIPSKNESIQINKPKLMQQVLKL